MGNLVLLEREPPVVVLKLNRPERHNSLVPEMLRELTSIFVKFRNVPDFKVLILRARGSSFSTGGDLRCFYEHLEDIGEYAAEIVHTLNQCLLAMLKLPKPIITAVNGIVTGGSMGLILASDFVLVTPRASFTPYYSEVGFSPDGGWTVIMPEIIGARRTEEIIQNNRTISAEQAVSWGIASELLVSPDNLEHRALELSAALSELDKGSLSRQKRLPKLPMIRIEEGLTQERDRFVQQIQKVETQERMIKFLEKM